MDIGYLKWLSSSTASYWWHDSAEPRIFDEAIVNGATGVTTNPLLVKRSLYKNPDFWRPYLEGIPDKLTGAEKAEEIIRRITTKIAHIFEPIYRQSGGEQGYVCAQVNPLIAGNSKKMLDMACRLHTWAPNIAVKLPVTAAGLDVLEECVSKGITVTATVSFTVPQTLAIARRHMAGLWRAQANGKEGGRCFAVVMVGRLDDYLRDVVHDNGLSVPEENIIQAGTAVIKRAYQIFAKEGYKAVLMPAGMRGAYHATALAGAEMSMSIAPSIQKIIASENPERSEHINEEIQDDVIQKLMAIQEFVRAYEPDGMQATEFITYGATQRTLSQFVEGWNQIEEFDF